MLRIKEFADLCGCSVYTLRYYDEINILKPSIVADVSRYRFYDAEQLVEYVEIKEFQEIGFNIPEIKTFKDKSNKEIADLILKKVNYIEELLDRAFVLREKYIGRK